jgi:transposase InsO family protein
MQALGLVSSQLTRHRYKKADQPHIATPSLLDRQFDAKAPNTVWTGYITCESSRKLLGQQSNRAFFRNLKTEWIPEIGYSSFEEAKNHITEYVVSYYNQLKPHTHNAGLTPKVAEQQYWDTYKTVAKKSWPLHLPLYSRCRVAPCPTDSG